MRLLLVRHGESEWNASRRLQGQADIKLSDAGRDQARRLRPVIEGLSCPHVMTSDLSRATETAALLGAGNAVLTPGLREIAVGDWTGADIDTLIADRPDDYMAWRAGDYAPPGGEYWADFSRRTVGAVEAVRYSHRTNVLVICHGGVIRALLEHYVGLTPRRIIPVGPASLTAIRLNGDGLDARLELFNYIPGPPEFEAPD